MHNGAHSEPFHLSIAPGEASQRLDTYLATVLDITRSRAQTYLSQGHVWVNQKAAPKSYQTCAGDLITGLLPAPLPVDALPEPIPLDIVYEDAHLFVINKPQGMVVHPAPGHATGTLVNGLLHHCGALGAGPLGDCSPMRPGIVHRLDKNTSGLLVAAKTEAAHHALSAQLAARTMGRTYHALAAGRFREDAFSVDAPLGRDRKDRKKMAVIPPLDHRKSRDALTHFRVLQTFPGAALVEARLVTGRTHQIRVHLAHTGHPVLGDDVYGGKLSHFPKTEGQLLHASCLALAHPATGETLQFTAPYPAHFEAALSTLCNKKAAPW